jgi:hypothetical protein
MLIKSCSEINVEKNECIIFNPPHQKKIREMQKFAKFCGVNVLGKDRREFAIDS